VDLLFTHDVEALATCWHKSRIQKWAIDRAVRDKWCTDIYIYIYIWYYDLYNV